MLNSLFSSFKMIKKPQITYKTSILKVRLLDKAKSFIDVNEN